MIDPGFLGRVAAKIPINDVIAEASRQQVRATNAAKKSIDRLVDKSTRLTRWMIGLTVALLACTVALVVLTVVLVQRSGTP